ncbi:hypothetical protein K438DRAFT_1876953 [Mycena galopus ATCC 62051]|nr:hypothetical protein K438DRAFT_1876953 [Mycena galopus ATCC 62051]
MYQAKPVEIQTSNFGGSQGTLFNDNQDGLERLPEQHRQRLHRPQHPIQQMDIYAGWCVDAITTTYRLSDGSTKVIKRGSSVSGSANLTSVKLNENEIVSQICRFAANYPYYNQSLLIQLSLAATDTSSGAVRITGVGYPSQRASHDSHSCGALAGYQTAGSAQIGISGLSIVKSNMVE